MAVGVLVSLVAFNRRIDINQCMNHNYGTIHGSKYFLPVSNRQLNFKEIYFKISYHQRAMNF